MTEARAGLDADDAHEEPVPVRRAVIGCLALALVGLALAGLVRPLIFTVAPPRDDTRVIVGTLTELTNAPIEREQLLSRSYGHHGEVDAGDGRVQVRLIVTGPTFGTPAVLNAASPLEDECPIVLGADRLVDCADRQWTLEGLPIDLAHPPLERFPSQVEDGAIVADLTRTTEE